jgi:Ca2+-transporting ATPase
MGAAILLVAGISFYQDSRSRKAIDALRAYTGQQVEVIRNNQVLQIPSREVVVGDAVVCKEGELLAADGLVIHGHDFSVNEAILTGESFSVFKNPTPGNQQVFQGTLAVSGLAVIQVTAIGAQTEFGKIGKSLEEVEEGKTPLQQQIQHFVRMMAIIGVLMFLLIWTMHYLSSRSLIDSLLKGLTLAMSILPEEIPVAFTTFMALGAWRLMKLGVVVKQVKTVESLGSATTICTDKTGTLTENRMELIEVYAHQTKKRYSPESYGSVELQPLISAAMWASEPVPFDPMEKALHTLYESTTIRDERKNFRMVHEYPLSGAPPMMTHVFEDDRGTRIIACKGAAETVLSRTRLDAADRAHIEEHVHALAAQGYRVLAVGRVEYYDQTFPADQSEFAVEFLGLLAFFDPPKINVRDTFETFEAAGIKMKIITGDNPTTTRTLARQIGLRGFDRVLNGDEIMGLDEDALKEQARKVSLFTRMSPQAKLRIVNAMKENGEIVAMTGDGVNDGPALKAANIGIAMGRRGSEVARRAAAIILTDDDLSKMTDAIALGRNIYNNLKRAIQYIISIHIPIILTVATPLFLGWKYPNIFTPVHVIFLELIMGPTCSIVYENEPGEPGVMRRPPRPATTSFLQWNELWVSILQGIVIALGTLSVYQYAVNSDYSLNETRSLVFITLILANVFLTLTNRSHQVSMLRTLRYKNHLMPTVILLTLTIVLLLFTVPWLRSFFELAALSRTDLLLALGTSFASVVWFEALKGYRRLRLEHAHS